MTHLAAGWSFRHRRTVHLTGWPPPYSPAQAGQMNASRTAAFASPAPVAAAQDVPAAARPPVAGRPRGTARKRRPDPHWPLDRDGRGDAPLLGGAAAAADLSVETKNDEPASSEVINWATAFGFVLALCILAMSLGLIRSEAANDLRTLTATGRAASRGGHSPRQPPAVSLSPGRFSARLPPTWG